MKTFSVSGSRRTFLRSLGFVTTIGVNKLLGLGPARRESIFGASGMWSDFSSAESREPLGPDPLYKKPSPITVEDLAVMPAAPVQAIEVNNYSPAKYRGSFVPVPPHADLNPKRAIIVRWKDHAHRFVFSHEGSYCPWMELPDGTGLGNQFFEGNLGYAELFNQNGRKEHNSSVDIIQSGQERVWVRWNYCCVNAQDDSRPALRGTEDYIAYPNGYVWRRLTYESLIPNDPIGYSWQPIDFYTVIPSTMTWNDLFFVDPKHKDFHVGSVLAVYSDDQYDSFWDGKGGARRNGDADLLMRISRSKGFALVMPFKSGFLFTVMGPASGFPSDKSQISDNSFVDTGGLGWRSARWDHWPIGWLNSQTHDFKPGSPYPYSFGPFSHWIIDKPLKDWKADYPVACRDMDLNRWTEQHVYYTLTGAARDLKSIRQIGRQWLDHGAHCTQADSIAQLLPVQSV